MIGSNLKISGKERLMTDSDGKMNCEDENFNVNRNVCI